MVGPTWYNGLQGSLWQGNLVIIVKPRLCLESKGVLAVARLLVDPQVLSIVDRR